MDGASDDDLFQPNEQWASSSWHGTAEPALPKDRPLTSKFMDRAKVAFCGRDLSMSDSAVRLIVGVPPGAAGRFEEATMKYMLLIIGSQDAEPTDGSGPSLMEQFMSYHLAVIDAGVMVDANVLESFETATSVQVTKGGDRLVTDGPFAETREYLGGYYILDLPDLDAAIDWAARCPGARAWRVEIRPVGEMSPS
jgi:hypothetical protein